MTEAQELPPREAMHYDAVIVGGGPAGLAAAIRLKQIAPDAAVVLVEKGSEIGAHILSGVVVDPIGLDKLLPGWRRGSRRVRSRHRLLKTSFYLLGRSRGVRLPNFLMPPLMNNHGNFVGSLGNVCRYLGAKAEELGVEIYPGFAAAEVLFGEKGEVARRRHRRHGRRPRRQAQGLFYSRHGAARQDTRFSPRAREVRCPSSSSPDSSWAKTASRKSMASASRSCGRSIRPCTGQGWCSIPSAGRCGSQNGRWVVSVSCRGKSDRRRLCGSPELHQSDAVALRRIPAFQDASDDSRRVRRRQAAELWRARFVRGRLAIRSQVEFPGGALVGCSAGFMNVPRIKGSHNAVLSGVQAADAWRWRWRRRAHDELSSYETGWRGSEIGRDFRKVRNVKPLWSKFGTWIGVPARRSRHVAERYVRLLPVRDAEAWQARSRLPEALRAVKPIVYPKPDGVLTFDKLSSVFISNTNHEEDQPTHLRLSDPSIPVAKNLPGVWRARTALLPRGGL